MEKSTYSLLNAETYLIQKCYCHCPTFFWWFFDKRKMLKVTQLKLIFKIDSRYKTVMAVSTISTKFIVPYTMLQEHFITDSKIYLITTQCWFLPVFFACVIKNDIQTHYKMKQKNLQWQVIFQLKLGVSKLIKFSTKLSWKL